MKRSISLLVCTLVLFACTQVLAQKSEEAAERLKFNGVWLYDTKQSKVGKTLKDLYKDQTLTIIYSDPKLEIKKVQTKDGETKSATVTVYTDRRGEVNNPFPFNEKERLASVTEWKGRSLVRLSVGEIPYKGSKLKIYIREVFSLSKDDKTLTVTEETFTDSPTIFFPEVFKKVYQRS